MKPIFETHIGNYILLKRCGEKDLYTVGNDKFLLIIFTDRVVLKGCILPTPIPERGIVINSLSNFWFNKTRHIIPNHLIDHDPWWLHWFYDDDWYYDEIKGRVSLVRKALPLTLKAMVRGYMTDSAYREYSDSGKVSGTRLHLDFKYSERLSEPLFSFIQKKNGLGVYTHLSFNDSIRVIGYEMSNRIREISIELYSFAEQYARERGIIIAETRFTFGFVDKDIILIDELLTPDSSILWSMESYEPGRVHMEMDKQYIIDYLQRKNWDGTLPPPEIPNGVIYKTREQCIKILHSILEDKSPAPKLEALKL